MLRVVFLAAWACFVAGPAGAAFVAPTLSLPSVRQAGVGRTVGSECALPLVARRRCVLRAGVALAVAEVDGAAGSDGDAPLTRKKKAVPVHVQDILHKVSTVNGVLEDSNRLSANDFSAGAKNLYRDNSKGGVLKTELYVRGLPWDMDNDGLKTMFKDFTPKYARSMKHKNTGRSLGFGFVGFPTAELAAKAMEKFDGVQMQGRVSPHTGAEIPGPMLSITLATAKSQKNRKLAGKSGKLDHAVMIGRRKAEIAARDMNKVVTGAEGMPRRWKVINDRNPEAARASGVAFAEGELSQDAPLSSDRAEAAVRDFLESHSIQDISEADLRKEQAELRSEGGEVAGLLLGDDDDDEDEDWLFVPGDGDGVEEEEGLVASKYEDFVEDEEEERRNWEDYQAKMRLNKENLKGDDVKASGALRSGQKKVKEWEQRPQR